MEKLPKAYEKKYMKMAMLKHEETFKQQVHELHRLYRTQKTLMKNVEKISPEISPISLDIKRNEIYFRQIYGHEDAKNDYKTSSTHNRTKVLDLEQETEDETKGNSKGGLQMIINENELQLTLGLSSYNNNTSDSGVTTHSSSSTGSIHDQAGTVTTATQNSSAYHQNNGSNRPGDQKKMLADYPPWLFQVVSLNMT